MLLDRMSRKSIIKTASTPKQQQLLATSADTLLWGVLLETIQRAWDLDMPIDIGPAEKFQHFPIPLVFI